MREVRIQDGAVWVGAERVPLYAGEVHYWRLSRVNWRVVLERVRGLGLGVVSTYVPWQFHELRPGEFDFEGRTDPARDLAGFLRLAAELKFHVFIRPGPYIYAEWTNAGVPDRVVTLPRMSAEYRREAAVWMAAVTSAVRPFFATNGGPICLFQADNEMDLFSHWFEGPCGLDGTAEGFFHDFLRGTYADVSALNRAWGTAYAQFCDATPYAEPVDGGDERELARRRDYWRFQHWAVREALRWHVEEYRRLGVDLPIVGNYYPGGDVQNWREVRKVVDLQGIDWYPRNEFGGDAEEHRKFLDTCRYQRAFSPLPFIAELECGVWHGYHDYVGVLTPNHYRLMACSAILAGIRGFNWYMLAGRDNWYYTPINERGEPRPELTDVLRGIHRVANECDLAALRKCTDIGVVIDAEQIGTDRILDRNPVLGALHEADLDFELYDAEVSGFDKPLMFYAAANWLAHARQERLREYIERGGTLVVFRQYPLRDEEFRPHYGLGIARPDRILSHLGKQVELELGEQRAVAAGAVWNWDAPPGEPLWGVQVAGRQQAVENADKWMTEYIGRRWICGYCEPRGRGRLVVLGLPANAALVRGVARWLGVRSYSVAGLSGVKTGYFERDGRNFLVATNLNDTELACRVELDAFEPEARLRITDLWTGTDEVCAAGSVHVRLARRSGGVWRIERPPAVC